MQLPQLQRGRALIITGPQGCGKSMLARELSSRQDGRSQEMDATQLDHEHGIRRALAARAHVLILDGLPATTLGWSNVKQLLSNQKLSYWRSYSASFVEGVPPLLIFTTNDIKSARMVATGSRRLDLLDLSVEPVSA